MAGLSSREIEEFKKLCYQGANIEYTYLGQSGKGKIDGEGVAGGIKVQHILSHVISDYGLSSGSYSRLIVDGKKIIWYFLILHFFLYSKMGGKKFSIRMSWIENLFTFLYANL